MKDLNKEGKGMLIIIPVILLAVVAMSLINNRTTREREMKESMETAVKEQIAVGIEEASGYRFQEELETIEFLGLDDINETRSGEATARVNIGMINLPNLLEEFLVDMDIQDHLKEGRDYYTREYEALKEAYMDKSPHVFSPDVEFRESDEGEWEVVSEEDLKIHSANRDIPLFYYGGLQFLSKSFDNETPFNDDMKNDPKVQSLVAFYQRKLTAGGLTVEREGGEEKHHYAIGYEGYDPASLHQEIETMLLSKFNDGELRKENHREGVGQIKEVMEDFFDQEDFKKQSLGEITLEEKGIGFALERDYQTIENPHTKLAEYLEFMSTPYEIPEFFTAGYQEFEIRPEEEHLIITGIGQEEEEKIILSGKISAGHQFEGWTLNEEELEKGKTVTVEREELDLLESHQSFDFAKVYHKENVSSKMLPVNTEDGSGFINPEGKAVVEPVEGLYHSASMDQGIPQEVYNLPLIFCIRIEEGEQPVDYVIDEEGKVHKDVSYEEIREIREAARRSSNNDQNQKNQWMEPYEENGLWGVKLKEGVATGEYDSKIIIEPQYDEVRIPLPQTRRQPPTELKENQQTVIAVKDGKERLINQENEGLLDKDYDEIKHLLSFDQEEQGFSRSIFSIKSGDQYGFYILTEDTSWLEEPSVDAIGLDTEGNRRDYRNRYPHMPRYFAAEKDGKWAAVDVKALEYATDFLFDEPGALEEGTWINHYDSDVIQGVMTVNEQEGLYDFYHNRWIVEPGEEQGEIYLLQDDRRRVERDGKMGYKDEKNEWFIEPKYEIPGEYDQGGDFYMGFAGVSTAEERRIIDQKGEVIYQEPLRGETNNFTIRYIPELELLKGGSHVYFTLEGELIYP